MRQLILLPFVAVLSLIGCDGPIGPVGVKRIEPFIFDNCFYEGGVKDTFAHGKGAVYCFEIGAGKVQKVATDWCYGEPKPCVRDGTYTGQEYNVFTLLYDGEWRDGQYHGQGTFYGYGNQYKGEWMHGKRNGQGISYNYDGSIMFRGEWRNDAVWTGQGTTGTWGGDTYVGEWKDGKPHGRGTLSDSFGKYVGEFRFGEKHGEGVVYDRSDRILYKSEWTNGERLSRGTYYEHDQNGARESRTEYFKDGKRYGQGAFEFMDGSTYNGELRDDMPNGKGTLRHKDGSTFVGEFKDGQLQSGQGVTYWFSTGHIEYQGEYVNGQKHGKGIRYFSDGNVDYQGEWCNDEPRPCHNHESVEYQGDVIQTPPPKEVAAPPRPEPIALPSLNSDRRTQASAHNSCYPSESRRLNEEGRVVVVVTIGTNGKMSRLQVSQSSGFSRLDGAAECVLRKLTFNPGTRDGQTVETQITMPITFLLE